jgi:integrase/recombinase XerC
MRLEGYRPRRVSKCLPPIEQFRLHLEFSKSPHTVDAYVKDVQDLERYLRRRGKQLVTARFKDLSEYLSSTRKRLANNSRARRVAGIRRFFRFAVSAELVAHDPSRTLAVRRTAAAPLTVPSVRRIFALLEAPPASTRVGLRDRAVLEILYGAGLRVSELTGMNLDSVDFGARMLRVMGKGSKERLCPINRTALNVLREYLDRRGEFRTRKRAPDTKALFLNRYGMRLTRNHVLYLVMDWAAASGLSRSVTPHTLRHAFATHMLKSGAKVDDVKELLGHSWVTSTQRYLHVDLEDLQRVYRKAHPRALPSIAPKPSEPCGMARCDSAELPAEMPALFERNAKAQTVRWSTVGCSPGATCL